MLLPLECIVVDDASTDDTFEAAGAIGASVIRLAEPGGPARARNRGAASAHGDVLLFVDADVCVQPDTVERVARRFAADPRLDALFGCYDDEPAVPDFLSQYRNLMHAFYHRRAREEASTFWSGCGAVRRETFAAHGGFDESRRRPSMEDIELGHRMYAAGRKIRLDRDLRVKHLKRWNLRGMMVTDVVGRGIPWVELILRDRHLPDDLNVGWSQRASLLLAWALAAWVVWGVRQEGAGLAAPLASLVFVMLGRYWSEFRWPSGGLAVAAAAAGLSAGSWLLGQHAGSVALALGWAVWLPSNRAPHGPGRAATARAVLEMGAAAVIAVEIARQAPVFAAGAGALAGAILTLNRSFYWYLKTRRGAGFAMAAIPFRLLYHLGNGISLAAGTVRFYWAKAGNSVRGRG